MRGKRYHRKILYVGKCLLFLVQYLCNILRIKRKSMIPTGDCKLAVIVAAMRSAVVIALYYGVVFALGDNAAQYGKCEYTGRTMRQSFLPERNI